MAFPRNTFVNTYCTAKPVSKSHPAYRRKNLDLIFICSQVAARIKAKGAYDIMTNMVTPRHLTLTQKYNDFWLPGAQ